MCASLPCALFAVFEGLLCQGVASCSLLIVCLPRRLVCGLLLQSRSTPLLLAARQGKLEAAQILVAAGAALTPTIRVCMHNTGCMHAAILGRGVSTTSPITYCHMSIFKLALKKRSIIESSFHTVHHVVLNLKGLSLEASG